MLKLSNCSHSQHLKDLQIGELFCRSCRQFVPRVYNPLTKKAFIHGYSYQAHAANVHMQETREKGEEGT